MAEVDVDVRLESVFSVPVEPRLDLDFPVAQVIQEGLEHGAHQNQGFDLHPLLILKWK